ncbi:hypothetical protein [Flavobacterium rhizosphaerae]|uniref:Uncharacterized protein n=1 Tax=Flavobacterium rhizosphaerae TaxID=3163298 RepID=A0ABW8YTN3_9FLAO
MKRIALMILFGLSVSLYAQNKNVVDETTTTKVTVNDGTGKPKTITKVEKTEANQDIELQDANSNKLNKDIKPTPVKVTKTTVIETDGIPKYYGMNGKKYSFIAQKTGYKVSSSDDKDYAIIRKTPSGKYIYVTKEATSVGDFDDEGNFVIETYNDKSGNVMVETYKKLDD